MFTLSTAGFSRSPSTTESVHQSNNSTNTSNNIQDSLLKLSNSSNALPLDASRPIYEISPKSRRYIENNLSHQLFKDRIYLIYSSSAEEAGNEFENKYKKGKWTFIENYRSKELPVFANEVTAYQYKIIAQKQGFYGELPKVIKRKQVENQETLALTKGKHGEELYNIFFEKTPNGKSTKRIMDNFGLRATAVRRVDYDENHKKHNYMAGAADFYIDIAPVNSKVTTK